MKANFETGLKICSKCRRELSIEMFNKNKRTFDGLEYHCRDCKKQIRQSNPQVYIKSGKKYRENHKEEIKQYSSQYYLNNKEVIQKRNESYELSEKGKEVRQNIVKRRRVSGKANEYNKRYFSTEKGKEVKRKIYEKRKEEGKINQYVWLKRRKDSSFALRHNLRSRINQAINRNFKSGHTLELLGCSIDYLRDYLEKQFESGMSWDNYGEWHIDHIIPCSYFDLTDPIQQRICFNYRNLQPLWGKENDSKGAFVPEDVEDFVKAIKEDLEL